MLDKKQGSGEPSRGRSCVTNVEEGSGPFVTSQSVYFQNCVFPIPFFTFCVRVGFSSRPLVFLLSPGTVDEEPSSVTGRKDSLSINLEFVKVSLSRMRRSGGPTFTESFIPAKGGKIDTTLINISGKSHPERGGFPHQACNRFDPAQSAPVRSVFVSA